MSNTCDYLSVFTLKTLEKQTYSQDTPTQLTFDIEASLAKKENITKLRLKMDQKLLLSKYLIKQPLHNHKLSGVLVDTYV